MALNQDIAFVVSLLTDGAETPETASAVMKQFLRTRLTSAQGGPNQGRLLLMDQFIDLLFHRYLTQHRSATQLGFELQARLAPHIDGAHLNGAAADHDAPARVHRLFDLTA